MEKLLTIKETLVYLEKLGYGSVTGQTIRDWCRGRGIGLKFGGQWRVKKEELDKMLKEGF